jgi:hypothetical protein
VIVEPPVYGKAQVTTMLVPNAVVTGAVGAPGTVAAIIANGADFSP